MKASGAQPRLGGELLGQCQGPFSRFARATLVTLRGRNPGQGLPSCECLRRLGGHFFEPLARDLEISRFESREPLRQLPGHRSGERRRIVRSGRLPGHPELSAELSGDLRRKHPGLGGAGDHAFPAGTVRGRDDRERDLHALGTAPDLARHPPSRSLDRPRPDPPARSGRSSPRPPQGPSARPRSTPEEATSIP